jgi:hypothetical protein
MRTTQNSRLRSFVLYDGAWFTLLSTLTRKISALLVAFAVCSVVSGRMAMADRAQAPHFVDILQQSTGVYRGKFVRGTKGAASLEFKVSAVLKGAPAATLTLPATSVLAYWSASATKMRRPQKYGFEVPANAMPINRELVLVVATNANSQQLTPIALLEKTDREYSYVQPVLTLLANDPGGLPFIEQKLADQQSDEFHWILSNLLNSPTIASPLRARLAIFMFRNLKRDFWSGYGELDHVLLHPSALPDLIKGLQSLKARQDSPLIGAALVGRFKDRQTLPLLATMIDDARTVPEVNLLHELYDAWKQTDPATYSCLMNELDKDDFVFGSQSSYESTAQEIARRADHSVTATCRAQLSTLFPPLDSKATLSATQQAMAGGPTWKKSLYLVAVRGTASPAVLASLLQLLESTRDEQVQQAVADTVVRLARRSDVTQSTIVFDAHLRVLTRCALLFPENHRIPDGMEPAEMGAHQRSMASAMQSMGKLVLQWPALTKHLRTQFETAPVRLQAQMPTILSWIAKKQTPIAQLQLTLELFAVPPAQAPETVLRSLARHVFLLAELGADPSAVVAALLESKRAIDRHAALLYLEWLHSKLPSLKSRVEAMAKSDPDIDVRARALKSSSLSWK